MFDCSIRWYPSLLPTMRQIVREQQPDLLVADHASAPAIDAAYEAGVPFVVLSGVLGNVLPSERTAPHFATSFPAAMSWRQRVVNRALPFWLRMQSRGRQARFAQVRAECGITAPFGEQFRDNLTIVTTCFGLELPRALPPRVHITGPIFRPQPAPLDTDLKARLDGAVEHGVIYVSFGTLASLDNRSAQVSDLAESSTEGLHRSGRPTVSECAGSETRAQRAPPAQGAPMSLDAITTLVNVLGRCGVQVLWSLSPAEQSLLPCLPENIRVENFVAQRAVLAHPAIRLAWLHGGSNSTQEALWEGLPLLVMPFFGDQHYNAARIEDAGCGLRVDFANMNHSSVAGKLSQLITQPSFRQAAERMALVLRKSGGRRQAANLLEMVMHAGTRHLIA